jgi:hypothetical protein
LADSREAVTASIEGRAINDIALQQLKRRMYACSDPTFSFNRRFAHLERVETLPMPGAPDEAWRRIDFSSFPLDRLAIRPPSISVSYPEARAKPPGIIIARDEALSEGGRLDEFYRRYADVANRRSGRVRPRANDVRENRLKSINEALCTRPLLIEAESESAEPVVVSVAAESDGLLLPQILIHGRERSRAHVIVVMEGANGSSDGSDVTVTGINRVKVLLEQESRLRLTVIVGGGSVTHFEADTALLDADAHLDLGYLVADCDPGMIESTVTLTAPGASVDVRGLSVASHDHFSGQKLTVEHLASHTESDTVWNSLLRESAQSLFVGNIAVPAGAKHSRGMEESHALLLSESARAESIPQLEIIENDVECSHGATASGLDPDRVYYLRSRGIPHATVENLLSSAFCRQIIDTLDLPSETYTIVKEAISNEIDISDDL